jgi:hypothetical protein
MTAPAPIQVPLHPDIEPISFLLGDWTGGGHGDYPTIADFDYEEEVRFWHVGKPFVAYTQRTRAVDDGRPLHSEMGYFRSPPVEGGPITVEVVVSQPSGIQEMLVGELRGRAVDLRSASIVGTPTAKRVDGTERSLSVEGDVLTYVMRMAAVGEGMGHHLTAELRRTPSAQ